MKKRLLVIGGVAAGPKAAAKARRCDPEMEIIVYQEEEEISYAGCGLPYYISGVVKERSELISRTAGQFARTESESRNTAGSKRSILQSGPFQGGISNRARSLQTISIDWSLPPEPSLYVRKSKALI